MPGAAALHRAAVIFDLDGVITDTVELHFQSWLELSREYGIPFDRGDNEALRGLSREDSLRLFLGGHAGRFTPEQQARILEEKNARFLARLSHLTPADTLPGARELLDELRRRGVPVAVASSSKNSRLVLERLGLHDAFDAVADGRDLVRSKPDPEVFLIAARRLGAPPAACVVIEDAESGVAGALAAGMKVIGIGPVQRVGAAHLIVGSVAELDAETVLGVLRRPAPA